MLKLRKIISRYLQIVALLMAVVILLVALLFHIMGEQRQAKETAHTAINQIEQLLDQNQKDLEETKAEYQQTCLYSAEAIAYMIQCDPSVLEDSDALKEIASLMEVDEIHIFDKTGRIFTGTHPEYYNLTFDSGEQIGFFKPLLTDYTLKLCQDITPNTAEGEQMQYSALWSPNKEFIVQVGMKPTTITHIMEKNELSYIFSMLRINPGINFYAINTTDGTIVGSTCAEDNQQNVSYLGFDLTKIQTHGNGFYAKVKGVHCYCVFEQLDDNYIGRVVPYSILYQNLLYEMLELGAWLAIVAIVLVLAVTSHMNRYVVNGIQDINRKLREITKGNLEEVVDVHSSYEFSELSNHINDMLRTLLSNTEKLSYVLNKTNMHIGVYEYNTNMEKIQFTEYIPQILSLNTEDERLSDKNAFIAYINEIRSHPVPGEEDIFYLNVNADTYIKIEEIQRENDTMGIMIDVTKTVCKHKALEEERDIDLLTGLYNRRGIKNKLTVLLKEPDKLNHAAIVMIDSDDLKKINDLYGHEKGDIYLCNLSHILADFETSEHCYAARLGGDEFILFLYGYDDDSILQHHLSKLKQMQDSHLLSISDEIQIPVAYSLGYCLLSEATDYHSMLEIADKRMYEDKRNRKKNKTPT